MENNSLYTIYLLRPSRDDSQHVSEEEHKFFYDQFMSALDSSVVMNIDDYARIFGVKPNRARRCLKRLAVVKITYKDECGKKKVHLQKIQKNKKCYDQRGATHKNRRKCALPPLAT